MDEQKYGKDKESEALQEAIREVKAAQEAIQLSIVNEKLGKISRLLAVVQV